MYIVDLLYHLTQIGFLKWIKSGESEFETVISGFKLMVFKDVRIHYWGEEAENYIVRTLKIIREFDGSTETFSDSSVSQLWSTAEYTSRRHVPSALENELCAGIMERFGIKP